MFRLTTLGSPVLADGAGAEIRSVLAQPKRLAVLAYVATEGAQGFVRRDTLLALFWPESDAEAARQALRQTLYHLRRETAEDLFVARSADEIAINRDVLWCDAVEFERCAGDRRYIDAMALYRGDFLPAFAFANQCAEFEQWLDRTRAAFRAKAAAGAAVLRDEAERAENRDAAGTWARVAAQLSPDDERATRRLIEVLDAGGDRGGALRAYDEFARHLWATYETRPSAATAALIADVRARTSAGAAVPPVAGAPPPRTVAGGAPVHAAPEPEADGPAGDPPAAGPATDMGNRQTIRSRRRPLAIAGGLATAALLVASLVLVRRARLAAAHDATTPTLAVLPFTHEGPASDSYLADGITGDIRGRLAGLPGLRVIAAASSDQYPTATEGVQRIGRELGAEYLLMGRVVRAEANDSTHVRVTPELIRVADATTAWTRPFDAAPTKIIDVQSQVAQAVVQALHVAVTDSARAALARLPTGNNAAYDAYLRGSDLFASGPADAVVIRKAVGELERAVALDTMYAAAWAELAVARTRLYENSGSPQRADIDRARVAAERALALDSTLPNAWAAMAGYYQVGTGDQARAIQMLRAGLRFSPRDPAILTLIAISERVLGQWTASVQHFQEAITIDPRNGTALYDLGITLFLLRRFPEARAIANQLVQLNPGPQDWQFVAMIPLAEGNLPAAREIMTRAGQTVDPTTLVTFVSTYGDLYWVLNDQQQALLLRLTPASFGDDRFNWSFALAGMSWVAGDTAALRRYADTARREGEASLGNGSSDPQDHALFGLANAYLGHRDVAVREGQLAVSLCPITKDAMVYAYNLQQLARIYVLVGDTARAVTTIADLLRIPSYVSVGWLRVDPAFAPLRTNSAFRRLIDGS